jgi:hypothetical protein
MNDHRTPFVDKVEHGHSDTSFDVAEWREGMIFLASMINGSGPFSPDFHFPTRENIAAWKAEAARVKAMLDNLNNMIRAAEALLSPDVANADGGTEDVQPEPDAPKRRGRQASSTYGTRLGAQTWTGTIENILRRVGRGLTHDELRTELAKTHLAKKLEQTDKSFYGAIGKLADRNLIVRHNGRLFAPAIYQRFMKEVAAGRIADEPAPRGGHQSPFGEAIRAFLDGRPSGASSSEIISELRKTPEFLDTIDRHKTHAYNVLSRLVDQGELMKGGGRYYRAPNKGGGGDALQSRT